MPLSLDFLRALYPLLTTTCPLLIIVAFFFELLRQLPRASFAAAMRVAFCCQRIQVSHTGRFQQLPLVLGSSCSGALVERNFSQNLRQNSFASCRLVMERILNSAMPKYSTNSYSTMKRRWARSIFGYATITRFLDPTLLADMLNEC